MTIPTFIKARDFLDPETRDEFWQFVSGLETNWTTATILNQTNPGQSNYAWNDLSPWDAVFQQLVTDRAAAWCDRLGIVLPTITGFETRLSRTGNDESLAYHKDGGNRLLTFLYYINAGRFDGGEMLLYGPYDAARGGEEFVQFTPHDNSIVAFDPSLCHEVLPVTCSDAYADGRFTMTVWITAP